MTPWRAILLCLLTGAALNVLVAWGCALWVPAPVRRGTPAAWTGGPRAGPWPSTWDTPTVSQIRDGPGYTGYYAGWRLYVFADGSGASTRREDPSDNPERRGVIAGVTGGQAGWPMRALRRPVGRAALATIDDYIRRLPRPAQGLFRGCGAPRIGL